MSEYKVNVFWKAESDDYTYSSYNRTHLLTFGGGTTIKASASLDQMGNGAYVNPEESLIAAISSAHMLSFIAIASNLRVLVEHYEDHASGVTGEDEFGKKMLLEVHLHPRISFYGTTPNEGKILEIHARAHTECHIANSVKTRIVINPIHESIL